MTAGWHLAVAALASCCAAWAAIACSSRPSIPDGGADATLDGRQDAAARDSSDANEAARDVRESASPADGGTPFLTQLAVVSASAPVDGSVPITLVPPFSSSIHDYYVRCAAGANPITVSMKASNGSKSLLVQPTSSPSLVTQTLSLSVNENQAIVAVATDGVATTEYWVRCLPHDFPGLRLTVHGAVPPAYYIMGTAFPGGKTPYAIVLDGNGVPVWYAAISGAAVLCVDNVVSGAISFQAVSPTDLPTYQFQIDQLSPYAISYAAPAGTSLDDHELRVLSNGHYLVLSEPIKTGVDLTGMSFPLIDGGVVTPGTNSDITNCNLVEFDPATGAVVWTWVGTDHLDPVRDPTVPQLAQGTSSVLYDGGVVDPFHCNSVDVDPANGNLLVSARHMDSVFYVDRSTGNILWKMGGNPKNGVAHVTVPDGFRRQHDARLLPGFSITCAGARGQVSVFDDETGAYFYAPVAPARGVIYDVAIGNAEGGASLEGGCGEAGPFPGGDGSAAVAWQYSGEYSSEILGSMRITTDGSRVIGWGLGYGPCWATGGCAPKLAFSVVDDAGKDLLDLAFTDGDSSYRAIPVPLTALDLEAMRRTAGLP